jgi:hypothetical protein
MGRKIQRLCGAVAIDETGAPARVRPEWTLVAGPVGARPATVDMVGRAERLRAGGSAAGE